jgi:transcriptional regulator with XRE-family HTH domain
MTGRDRRLDRATHRARELVELAARELLTAREQAGLSQDAAGRVVGMSGSQVGRIERAELRGVSLEQLCRAAAAVGLAPRLRFYPDGDPVRDIAHVRLLERLRVQLPASVRWRTEVPLPGVGDPRSWDAQLWFADTRDAVEAETRIRDAQAAARRAAMKLRDDPSVAHLILLVADTTGNRRSIEPVRALLRSELPLDSGAVLKALRSGRSPGSGGILFL